MTETPDIARLVAEYERMPETSFEEVTAKAEKRMDLERALTEQRFPKPKTGKPS